MIKKSASALAEDQALSSEIAKAHSFSAFLFNGPFDRRRVIVDEGGPAGYAKARAIADDLDKVSRYGRRAIVYAINSLGSFPISDDLAKQAGLI